MITQNRHRQLKMLLKNGKVQRVIIFVIPPVIVVILDFGHDMLHYFQWVWSSWTSVTTCYTMSSDCGHLRFWSPHATLCPVIVVILDFAHHMLHYVQWLWSSWISVTTCYTMFSDCGHLRFWSPHATLCPVIVVILDFVHHMLHYVQWLWSS